ncbi:MAG: Alpha-galactosidase [Clostridiales bacterium]|nr:Alpha-galactosidase [Clostridiales bacterium]
MYPYEGFIKYRVEGQEIALKFALDRTLVNEHLEICPKLTDRGRASLFECTISPKIEIQIITLLVKTRVSLINTDRVFLNGFQTWTESREYEIDEKIQKLNRLAWNILSPYGDYTFYPHNNEREKIHSFTYTYINKNNESYILYGSLSESSGYTIFQYNTIVNELSIIKDCTGLNIINEYKAFEVLISSGKEDEVFKDYFTSMNIEKPAVKSCTGWTSWYNYYTGITEEIIIRNLNAFSSRSIPIDIFQIDDGYQKAVGDWLIINKKFPKGMKYIADSIKEKGYKPGLWLAPFICEKRSMLYRSHREWLLKDENGKLIRAGFNPGWSGTFYALDFYNQEVRDYLIKVFDAVLEEWGFEILKLDFLYAVALLPRKNKTRGQIMYEAMKFIREIVGEKLILGCGVPLGSSFGIADYCRIGSDVALKWEDKLLKGLNYRERVSTINSLRSTIGRRHLNGNVFYNDPDVFILRERNNTLTKDQRNTLLILNLIFGGLVFTSDNIDEYSEEEMKLYLSLFPNKDKRIQRLEYIQEICKVEFKIEDRSYIVISNLSDREVKLHLNQGVYFEKTKGFINGEMDVCLKANETLCLLVLQNMDFEIAGSNNIFPGNEVIDFKVEEDNIFLKIHEQCRGALNIFIRIPDEFENFRINGEIINADKINGLNILRYIKSSED